MNDTLRALDNDTIAAQATPPGRGGVGIVRLSGPQAYTIARTLCKRSLALQPRYAHFARFHDAEGQVIDEGLVLFFPGPNSFTGEDVV
ncbi:MAG TPA: tRNA uridine-5-carboxymethylaminomethyl(34) synthesis GTPase MnmE, partial [Gammaproteobacteria bacterium]|nr:tRNA uridine-5-carboxymethylaminomethyl(34) synthesis GTPase MnmE [Gammaproteobacteria bacterium]